MNSQPRILIGCTTADVKDYCLDKYIKAVKPLTYPNADILIVDNSKDNNYFEKIKKHLPVIKAPYEEDVKDRIINSRNIIREKVLNENYDYFFSLEQDVIPPKDTIQRLLAHNKKIISGVYLKLQQSLQGPYALVALLYIEREPGKVGPMLPNEIIGKGLKQVSSSGLGCILIHKSVLEKVKFRYVKEKPSYDDMWFCIDAKTQGFNIYADGNISCEHYH